ncbi:MAG: hypothetical protein AAGD00_05450 [Planctomycetota bacterium]
MTLRELLMVLACMVLLFVVFMTIMPSGPGRDRGNLAKEMSQQRRFLNAMSSVTQVNDGKFMLPSILDANGQTLRGPAKAKDTSANIFSFLIWQRLLEPDSVVSSADRGNVEIDHDYQFESPSAAVDPANALWDPSFRADFTGDEPGNLSFAHASVDVLVQGLQGDPSVPLISTRWPRIESVTKQDGSVRVGVNDPQSITFRFFKPANAWSGAVGMSDGSSSPHEHALTHIDADEYLVSQDLSGSSRSPYPGSIYHDILFYDEPDDPSNTNHFLGIFIEAGATRDDFKPIWD